MVSTGFLHRRGELAPLLDRVRLLLAHCQGIRRMSAPAIDICWVASGRLDAHTETLSPWELAAAELIAEQAGARRGESPWRTVLAPS